MGERLTALVSAVTDARPTLDQIDEMLAELSRLPRADRVVALIDDLLDYRALLAA